MSAKTILMAASALLLGSSLAIATEMQAAPGGGIPAAGGKGPGMGHDYRRNVGGAGMRHGVVPAGQREMPLPQTAPPAPSQSPTRPPEPPQAPGVGYRGNPAWNPGTAAPYRNPNPGRGYSPPGRRGYGYPGYRGHGGSPYPRHRQYANPPLHPIPVPREQE